jgi:hypothetical protein
MVVENNNIALVDQTIWEVLTVLPVPVSAGICMANDLRKTDRYIYYLTTYITFYRYDTISNTFQRLADAPGGTAGLSNAMIYDPSYGTAGGVWAFISNGSVAPVFCVYDVATNTWTNRSVTNLGATMGVSTSMTHTCSTYNAAGNDDYIYLIGNNATIFYRYTISTNSWTTMTVCLSTSATGCQLHWTPVWNTDYIVRMRGGATATLDYYSIVGNSWASLVYVPATETYTTGTMSVYDPVSGYLWLQKDATLRLYYLDLSVTPAVMGIGPWVSGPIVSTVYTPNRMCLVKDSESGVVYVYIAPHTGQYFSRGNLI